MENGAGRMWLISMEDSLVVLKRFVEEIVSSKLTKLNLEYNYGAAVYSYEYKAFLYGIHNVINEAIDDAEAYDAKVK